MAGTVTVSEDRIGRINKITFAWTSSSGGAADGVTTGYYTGEIVRAVQIPGTSGTQPTNAYDIVVNDSDSADALVGLGANLSNAANTSSTTKDGLGAIADTQLTLAVTNAGNAKTGSTILYIKVR
jgi:hypothetical protein